VQYRQTISSGPQVYFCHSSKLILEAWVYLQGEDQIKVEAGIIITGLQDNNETKLNHKEL